MAVYRGLEKGDKSFRHFTYDGEITYRAGKPYYKVTYKKDKMGGEFAEAEVGYVECGKVIPVGAKPDNFPGTTPQPVQQPVSQPTVATPEPEPVKEVKHRGRPKKQPEVKAVVVKNTTIPIKTDSGLFEYRVDDINFTTADELQSKLNELGNDGWELCGFDVDSGLFSGKHIIVIFKRQK